MENCKERVYDRTDAWSRGHQCSRKASKDGYCKQHHPEAVKARRDAETQKWKAEWDEKNRRHQFQMDCIKAVNDIAAGHNDPRALCLDILARLTPPTN